MSESNVGCLYIVATPIGNLADMSARAIDVLQQVDLIAAEDTRHSKHLLQHFSVATPTISLHEHNEQQRSQMLLGKLQNGESIALISDAGTPLISDPGYRLVSLVREHGVSVVPIPGCCAVITALSASGLAADSFSFEGFLPSKASARQKLLQSLSNESRTLIFYESPKRLLATLKDMVDIIGEERRACLARELTKLHETIITMPLSQLYERVEADSNQQKGECVLLIEATVEPVAADEVEVERVLTLLLQELPLKKAAALTASMLSISKNKAYEIGLKVQQKS